MDKGYEQEVHLKTGAQPHSSSAKQDKTVALLNLSDCQNYALQTSASGLEDMRCAGNVSGALATALHIGTLGTPTMSWRRALL